MSSSNGKIPKDTSLEEFAHTIVFVVHTMAALNSTEPAKVCDTLIQLAPRKYIKEALSIIRSHFKANKYQF